LNLIGDAATNAHQIITDINAAYNAGKPHEASMNFNVSYKVNDKPVTFDANGLPIIPKIENEEDDNGSGLGGEGDAPPTITLTVKNIEQKDI
jgi:hypothetical protein